MFVKNKITAPNLSKYSNKKNDLKRLLKKVEYRYIDQYTWGKANEHRKVRFKIAHNNNNIYLLFDVVEPEMKATYSNHNDPIYKDSCVEFFIALEEDSNYYNFEFNCLGSCLLEWGPDRHHRKLLDTHTIDLIKVNTKIKRETKNDLTEFHWKMFIKIPIETFKFNPLKSLKNINAKANFYKCGDNLSKPHYISWNPIKADEPDFHLKSYFGDLIFK